ncbi:T9SS type A sorting domain-containing protein [bacterium]|nr:T9SS type A sorting domain-containing protein [bacterium]
MRPALLLGLLLVLISAGTATAQPADCYHSVDEINARIFELQDTYPEMVRVDSIGHSAQENLPIYLVKISDNVNVDEDEPANLFIGHIHGEEILGIETLLSAMDTLLTNPRQAFAYRRAFLENYFIITMNPEGLNVVFGIGDDLVHGADELYRKNKRDVNSNGLLDYVLGWGNDFDGVDLNRNWDLHFYQGDTLGHYTTETERYDYYRGTHPFSEPEARAVRWAFENVQPMFSTTYHSSRQGGLAEKVFFPWDWGSGGGDGLKLSPDYTAIQDVSDSVAYRLHKRNGLGTYQSLPSAGRKGKMHDWAYAAGGWINLEIELSNDDIQPNCDIREEIVVDALSSIWHMMDRSIGNLPGLSVRTGTLKMVVSDDMGEPLVAEVLLPEQNNGYLHPRMTDPVHGVHRRVLMSGNYDIVTRQFGYAEDERTVYVGENGVSTVNVTLEPLPRHDVLITVTDPVANEPLDATLIVHRAYGVDTVAVENGELPVNWPEGFYSIDFYAEGYIPQTFWMNLSSDELVEMFMVEPGIVQLDDFENGLPEHWSTGGDEIFQVCGLDQHSGDHALKSFWAPPPVGELNIPLNTAMWAQASYQVPYQSTNWCVEGWYKYELEPDFDFAYVDIRMDNGDWMAVDTLNGYREWYYFFYDLSEYNGVEQINIRWRVETDASDQDRGLFLDDIALVSNSDQLDSAENTVVPLEWSLEKAYPNPFNPSTTIRFEVRDAGMVELAVYDILGRQVAQLVSEEMTAGRHARLLDLSASSSGVYFVQMNADGYTATRKIVLIK